MLTYQRAIWLTDGTAGHIFSRRRINIKNPNKSSIKKLGAVALTMIGVMVALFHAFASSNSGTPSSCYPKNVVFPDYIQVNETKFVAGERRLSAWRIHPDNSLDMALWTGNGELRSSVEHAPGVQGLYTRIAHLQIPLKEKAAGDNVLGRSAYSVIVSQSKNGQTTSVQSNHPPSDLIEIIKQLNNSIDDVHKANPGGYLWVQPVTKPADVLIDLNRKGACAERQMAQSAEAIIDGKLLTTVDAVFNDTASKEIQLGTAVSLKAGPGWYVVGRIKTAD